MIDHFAVSVWEVKNTMQFELRPTWNILFIAPIIEMIVILHLLCEFVRYQKLDWICSSKQFETSLIVSCKIAAAL